MRKKKLINAEDHHQQIERTCPVTLIGALLFTNQEISVIEK